MNYNLILNILIIGYLIYDKCKDMFWIKIDRTFWTKRLVSITLMRVTQRFPSGSFSSIGVIRFPIRNRVKADKRDSQQFKNRQSCKL